MRRAWVIVRKEWREILGQRALVFSLLVMPTMMSVMPLVLLALVPELSPDDHDLRGLAARPEAAGLSGRELAQLAIGQQFGLMLLLLPQLVPAVLAAQSIVGEKVRKTLEPLLSTPITTTELLVGKCLSALIPAVLLTWIAAGVFVLGVTSLVPSARVVAAVLSPAWVFVLLGSSPLLALVAIAVTVLISSKVSDPRAAQQASALLVLPLVGVLAAQAMGVFVLGPGVAAAVLLGLGILAWGTLRLAVRLFDREAILTRWK
jgi:ABC-2 type transport system permease protein